MASMVHLVVSGIAIYINLFFLRMADNGKGTFMRKQAWNIYIYLCMS